MGADKCLRLCAALLLSGVSLAARAGQVPDPLLGERLYVQGLLASGAPLAATTQGDIGFSGTQFSCANCHRRSGYGSSEGGNYVPPVTGPVLFQARSHDRAQLFKKLFKETQPKRFWARMRMPRVRPAYTVETLARAIREGVDPAGNPLAPLMPRYSIPDADLANLAAYLKTLSARPDPGVDRDTIHFATVVGEGVDPGKREAMLATMRRFVEWMNLDTRGDLSKPHFSPNYRDEFIKAYRAWTLDVWELKGDPDTWHRQLADAYAARPVFAVISGLADGPWRPVQTFCEKQRLPCLFPHTELPSTDGSFRYSVFFNRGLTLEAEVVARHLRDTWDGSRPVRVLQVHIAGPDGRVPAGVLRKQFQDPDRVRLETRRFADAAELRAGLARIGAEGTAPDVLVVWPGDAADAALRALAANTGGVGRIYLPSAAVEAVPAGLSTELSKRLLFSFPYEVPGAYHPRAFRVRGWMHARGLDIDAPRLQFDTYYALTVMQFGLEHIVDAFSREYLLEYVEHEAENALNPGTFPHLSLGPGQRFASKGAYVVRLAADPKSGLRAVSPWIVP